MVACNMCFDLQIKRFFHSEKSVLCVIRLINHSLIIFARISILCHDKKHSSHKSSPYLCLPIITVAVLGNNVRVCAQVQN